MNTDHTAGLDPDTFEAAPGDAWGHFEAEGPDQAQDQATIALTLTQVADLVDLLDEIDEFLRLGHHAIDALTDFYRTHHDDNHPRFVALCLVDSVSFTALSLRGRSQAANQIARDQGAQLIGDHRLRGTTLCTGPDEAFEVRRGFLMSHALGLTLPRDSIKVRQRTLCDWGNPWLAGEFWARAATFATPATGDQRLTRRAAGRDSQQAHVRHGIDPREPACREGHPAPQNQPQTRHLAHRCTAGWTLPTLRQTRPAVGQELARR